MEPEAPQPEPPDREASEPRKPPLHLSRAASVLAVVLLVLVGAIVGIVVTTSDSGTPSKPFEQREVLEVILHSSARWDAVPVTCIARGDSPASDCLDPLTASGQSVVLLSEDGSTKYRMGPSLISRADIASASAVYGTGIGQGWEVDITFTPDGAKRLAAVTTKLVGKQLAIVVDGRVVSAPIVQSPITNGSAVITGGFTEQDAKNLAEQIAPPH